MINYDELKQWVCSSLDSLELEKECRKCCGAKKIKVKDRKKSSKITCPDCDGRGYHITDLGHQILDFIKRNLLV